MARRFVLLDRDGTLNVERHYLSNPKDLELLPGVGAGLRRLSALGLVVVTNQSGIARGYFDQPTLLRIHARLRELLAAESVTLDGIYFCEHSPKQDCPCRKPRPGMAIQAALDHGFELQQAFVIGDKPADIQLARAVGAAAILVTTGYGAETLAAGDPGADHVATDLADAAEWIASQVMR